MNEDECTKMDGIMVYHFRKHLKQQMYTTLSRWSNRKATQLLGSCEALSNPSNYPRRITFTPRLLLRFCTFLEKRSLPSANGNIMFSYSLESLYYPKLTWCVISLLQRPPRRFEITFGAVSTLHSRTKNHYISVFCRAFKYLYIWQGLFVPAGIPSVFLPPEMLHGSRFPWCQSCVTERLPSSEYAAQMLRSKYLLSFDGAGKWSRR